VGGGNRHRTTKATTFNHRANWIVDNEPLPYRIFRIKAFDVAGNEGGESTVLALVTNPGSVQSLTAQVLMNQITLSWQKPAYSYWRLPISYYEIRKGATWAGGTVLGQQFGTQIVINESVGGTYTYWVLAVDSAGNIGPVSSLTATCSGPDNFTLVQEWPSSFDQAFVNAMLSNGAVLMPVNQSETYQQHFDNAPGGANSTWQAMIDDGFDQWLEATPNSGSYAEIKDYGSTIVNQTSIRVEKQYLVLSGAPVLSCKIEVSLNSDMSSPPCSTTRGRHTPPTSGM